MIGHKTNCYNEKRKHYNINLYKFIRANGGWSNFCMEELCKCDVERLHQVEQEYIDKYKPSLNSQRAYRSQEQKKEYERKHNKEYRKNNKDKLNEYNREYQKNNKDIINEKRNKKINCNCGGRYTKRHMARHFKTKKHQYYISNNPEYLTHCHNQLEN